MRTDDRQAGYIGNVAQAEELDQIKSSRLSLCVRTRDIPSYIRVPTCQAQSYNTNNDDGHGDETYLSGSILHTTNELQQQQQQRESIHDRGRLVVEQQRSRAGVTRTP
eukprot:scaffold1040_cov165-Amphora_coffeaeformis.AAC.3